MFFGSSPILPFLPSFLPFVAFLRFEILVFCLVAARLLSTSGENACEVSLSALGPDVCMFFLPEPLRPFLPPMDDESFSRPINPSLRHAGQISSINPAFVDLSRPMNPSLRHAGQIHPSTLHLSISRESCARFLFLSFRRHVMFVSFPSFSSHMSSIETIVHFCTLNKERLMRPQLEIERDIRKVRLWASRLLSYLLHSK
jgi:hypothetical protein